MKTVTIPEAVDLTAMQLEDKLIIPDTPAPNVKGIVTFEQPPSPLDQQHLAALWENGLTHVVDSVEAIETITVKLPHNRMTWERVDIEALVAERRTRFEAYVQLSWWDKVWLWVKKITS